MDAKKQQQPGTARTEPLWLALMSTSQMVRPDLFVLYVLKGALEASDSHWVPHVQCQLFDSPGTITTCAEVPESRLVARCGSSGNTSQATEQSLLRRWTSLTQTLLGTVLCTGVTVRSLCRSTKCTGVSLIKDTRVYPVDRIVHRLTPPRRLQGRLGGVVICRRSADAQEDSVKS